MTMTIMVTQFTATPHSPFRTSNNQRPALPSGQYLNEELMFNHCCLGGASCFTLIEALTCN